MVPALGAGMNNTSPRSSLLVRLGLLALLAVSVGCAHDPSALGQAGPMTMNGGPGGKGVWTPSDRDSTRSAPNFVERASHERLPMDRVAMPPNTLRR